MKKIALTTMISAAVMTAAIILAMAESSTEGVTETAAESAGDKGSSFDDAVAAALQDAGLDEKSVIFNKKMRTFEDGMPVYEIRFLVPGETKYEYVIAEGAGEILEKENESWEAEDDEEYASLLSEVMHYFDFYADEAQVVMMPAVNKLIDECARDRQEELVYYKDGVEFDDGRIVYELGAMIPKELKFEYTFDMETGEVIESETENWEAEDDEEYREILETHGFSAQ